MNISRFIHILGWAKTYSLSTFSSDLIAAVIVTIMLIPQSLAADLHCNASERTEVRAPICTRALGRGVEALPICLCI